MFEALLQNQEQIYKDWSVAWAQAGAGALTQAEAEYTLDLLWQRSHLDIALLMPSLKKHFPTKQGYRKRLQNVKSLGWLDHATAGVNGWGTMGWFSSAPRKHTRRFDTAVEAATYAKRRKGATVEARTVTWKGYAGACTHFVAFTDGTPFMILPLEDAAWGEPKRNGDSIQIETVNALLITRRNGKWCSWAGPLPSRILDVQKPVKLDAPFRGAQYMLPYTWEQVVTNIKLKRLCIAATGRMDSSRMSQHTDWRTSKYDMGPLWPYALCNKAAFETYPVEEYSFIQRFVRAPGMDPVVDLHELEQSILYAEDPNTTHDLYDEDDTITSVTDVQQTLLTLYKDPLPKYGADGDLGPETTEAVRIFQQDWNVRHKDDVLTVDGIPGVETCARLERATAGE